MLLLFVMWCQLSDSCQPLVHARPIHNPHMIPSVYDNDYLDGNTYALIDTYGIAYDADSIEAYEQSFKDFREGESTATSSSPLSRDSKILRSVFSAASTS